MREVTLESGERPNLSGHVIKHNRTLYGFDDQDLMRASEPGPADPGADDAEFKVGRVDAGRQQGVALVGGVVDAVVAGGLAVDAVDLPVDPLGQSLVRRPGRLRRAPDQGGPEAEAVGQDGKPDPALEGHRFITSG